MTEKYGLNVDKESHKIANAVEKNFIASRAVLINRDWQKIIDGKIIINKNKS